LCENQKKRCKAEYDGLVRDAEAHFARHWVSWYHFLGVDVSMFPTTKDAWVVECRARGIGSWGEYQRATAGPAGPAQAAGLAGLVGLPIEPAEMYDSYTNWDEEFGTETLFW
jgi:hypothetical protein